MKEKIFIAFLLLINHTAFAQEPVWSKQTKLSAVIAFEKNISDSSIFLDQNVSLTKNYYPLYDKYPMENNPLTIQRPKLGYLPLYTEYFFTPQDSIVRLISYDWEIDRYGNFFKKQKIWEKESKKIKTYNSEYERIRNLWVKELGTPTQTDTELKEEKSEQDNYFTRETVWETEAYHAALSLIFASTTYRVRLTLYWKK